MQYKVLETGSIARMEKLVNQYIREGWELQGGTSKFIGEYAVFYTQAVIFRQ